MRVAGVNAGKSIRGSAIGESLRNTRGIEAVVLVGKTPFFNPVGIGEDIAEVGAVVIIVQA